MSDYTKNDGRSSIVSGIIILGVGLYFLGVNWEYLPPVSDSWPFFLVIVGVALIVGNLFRRRRSEQESGTPPPPHP
ncbi:MAG: DUF5668 domain-containing protein [candidate division Zixibacteria bacterium]|nr:DUF5668 domain-containing protein [candidate division Zixibacteria bacterium]